MQEKCAALKNYRKGHTHVSANLCLAKMPRSRFCIEYFVTSKDFIKASSWP